ncbi:MAG TPA: hypothetical protein VK892_12150 [Pyrinomonadaceae bacterium]|nr:hypothetical protein [Pyrinomonadaceae bacterium]
MKKVIISTLNAYRQYRVAKAKSKTYQIFRYSLLTIVGAYFLTICFPQYLFAHEVAHKNFKIYSREPMGENIYKILDDAETRLSKSTIYDAEISRRVFLTNSHGFYTFLSNKAFRSFANSVPLINNILVNKSDTANDLVYLNRPQNNKRSLSGVIAHEVTHLFIRKKLGNLSGFTLPTWKNEGYCEYIAGDTTITFEEGVKLWKENPNDDSKYRYFKYHLRIKYLLETEKLTIDDVFNQDFDERDLDAKVFSSL